MSFQCYVSFRTRSVMNSAVLALCLFISIIGGFALFYAKLGMFSFWKLATKIPDLAFEYISNDEAWLVVNKSDCHPGKGYIGPFWLAVPSIGRSVKFYVREDQVAVWAAVVHQQRAI